MKKILLAILMVMVFVGHGWATDYYGCKAASNIKSADDVWCTTPTTACAGTTTVAWATVNNSGNNLYANGCAMTIANGDTWNLGTGKLSTEAGAGNAGGSFTMANGATVTATSYAVAGTTACLVVGGTGALTLNGNATGGSASAAYGVYSNGTTATVTINGTSTGGSAITAYGYYGTTSGLDTILNVNGGSIAGADGARKYGTGAITITGNIINTATSAGASGRITYTPANATKYIQYGSVYYSAGLASDAGGTAITGANTAAQVATGTYFVKKDDGVMTQGSKSGGGGAWAF